MKYKFLTKEDRSTLKAARKDQLKSELEDIAYAMRHDSYSWFGERWCFELTEIRG